MSLRLVRHSLANFACYWRTFSIFQSKLSKKKKTTKKQAFRFFSWHNLTRVPVISYKQHANKQTSQRMFSQIISRLILHYKLIKIIATKQFFLAYKTSENIFGKKIQESKDQRKKILRFCASFQFPAIRFDAPTILSFGSCTHAHENWSPVLSTEGFYI